MALTMTYAMALIAHHSESGRLELGFLLDALATLPGPTVASWVLSAMLAMSRMQADALACLAVRTRTCEVQPGQRREEGEDD